MANRVREEIRRLHADLYKLVKNHPSSEGLDLLERYEKIMLDPDLLIGSKSALKEKLNVVITDGEGYKAFATGTCIRRRVPNYEFEKSVISEETMKKLIKEEFVKILEDDFLNKML